LQSIKESIESYRLNSDRRDFGVATLIDFSEVEKTSPTALRAYISTLEQAIEGCEKSALYFEFLKGICSTLFHIH
jgi:hypothetical protein